MKKILIPTDGSSSSVHAIQRAKELGIFEQGELYLLSVIKDTFPIPFDAGAEGYIPGYQGDPRDSAARALEEAKQVIGEGYTIAQATMPQGDAAKKIIENAKEISVDLIVMGNRGLGAFSRTFLGSVSNKVLHQCDCSILIIKEETE